jgi:hypothetical protein
VKFVGFVLFLAACAHQAVATETLHNIAASCPADTIVVELPAQTQSVDAVATLVAQTKSLTYTPSTSTDAVSVIRERIAEDSTRRCP